MRAISRTRLFPSVALILRETSLETYGAWVTLGGLLAIASKRSPESGESQSSGDAARRGACGDGHPCFAVARA